MASLSIGAGGVGGSVFMPAGTSSLLQVDSLVIASDAKLDLNDNDMIVDYTGGSQLGVIQALINSARNGGLWDGDGITSSSALNNTLATTTLGAMEATQYDAIHGSGALFNGVDPDATAVLVKYTYYGDADFSGEVDFDDYVRLDAGFNNSLSGWPNGDFDGNGIVDFDDTVLIDLAFNLQGAPL
jgi:hypothetical protein